jgi:hypothetical protein
MSCQIEIDVADIDEVRIVALNRVTFDFALLFFLDEDETEEDTLEGSRFDMTVKDRNGVEILKFSTEEDPGGLTIVGYNELDFLKSAEEMNLTLGVYKYLLHRTVAGVVTPVMYGDFVITDNPNELVNS